MSGWLGSAEEINSQAVLDLTRTKLNDQTVYFMNDKMTSFNSTLLPTSPAYMYLYKCLLEVKNDFIICGRSNLTSFGRPGAIGT
jgi:hypothetical protein